MNQRFICVLVAGFFIFPGVCPEAMGGLSSLASPPGLYRLTLNQEEGAMEETGELTEFWNKIIGHLLDARPGGTIRVSLGNRSTVPADVLRELRGLSVTLVLREKDGSVISIYGKEMDKIPENRTYYNVSTLRNLFGEKNSLSSSSVEEDVVILPPIPVESLPELGIPPDLIASPEVTSPQITVPLQPPVSSMLPDLMSPPETAPPLEPTLPSETIFPPEPTAPPEGITPPDSSRATSSFDAFEGVEEEPPLPSNSLRGEIVTEVAAEEDEASEPDIPREAASQPIDMRGMMLFVGAAALLAALGGSLFTYFLLKHKNRH